MRTTIGWQKADASSDQSQNPGSAPNGAARRVDVRRVASPLGVIDPYGVLRDACFAVGAAIGRPQNDPPNMEHAEANS